MCETYGFDCDFSVPRTWLAQPPSSLGYATGMGRSPPGCTPHGGLPHQSSTVNPFASHQLQGQVCLRIPFFYAARC